MPADMIEVAVNFGVHEHSSLRISWNDGTVEVEPLKLFIRRVRLDSMLCLDLLEVGHTKQDTQHTQQQHCHSIKCQVVRSKK